MSSNLDEVISDSGMTRREAMFSNDVAAAVLRHYGWAPLSARYGAADAAIVVLRDDARIARNLASPTPSEETKR